MLFVRLRVPSFQIKIIICPDSGAGRVDHWWPLFHRWNVLFSKIFTCQRHRQASPVPTHPEIVWLLAKPWSFRPICAAISARKHHARRPSQWPKTSPLSPSWLVPLRSGTLTFFFFFFWLQFVVVDLWPRTQRCWNLAGGLRDPRIASWRSWRRLGWTRMPMIPCWSDAVGTAFVALTFALAWCPLNYQSDVVKFNALSLKEALDVAKTLVSLILCLIMPDSLKAFYCHLNNSRDLLGQELSYLQEYDPRFSLHSFTFHRVHITNNRSLKVKSSL